VGGVRQAGRRIWDRRGGASLYDRNQFLVLVFAQLGGASSLREVEAVMASHQARLYHVGAKAPKRSTFADANRNRDPRVFSKLFEHRLAASPRGLRRKMGEVVRLIDSTSLRLAGAGAQWARFSSAVFGAKAHVLYDPDLGRPVYHAVTAANVNDITAAKPMPIDPGATYVFDLGYYDFSWWAQLDGAGCRLVTRFKANTPLREAKAMPLAEGSDVLSDHIGFLPARQGNKRKNPMREAVREIAVETETGKRLRILTNDLDAPAQEIAGLYKRRWQIELFFRVMKQTLRITKFVGRSENAVRIQIAVALIVHLRLRMLQKDHERRSWLPRARSTRARQSDAQKRSHTAPKTPASPRTRLASTPTLPEPNLNRTAVAQGRPPTRTLQPRHKPLN
jgi:hypothetical protein